MITTLEERKINLLSQIEKLKREINELKRLEYREIALCHCTSSVRYIVPDRLRENSVN
jgi:metal-dependent hydrolase (beta-lactamase superfamily II)